VVNIVGRIAAYLGNIIHNILQKIKIRKDRGEMEEKINNYGIQIITGREKEILPTSLCVQEVERPVLTILPHGTFMISFLLFTKFSFSPSPMYMSKKHTCL
jgi:hypothetical protein